ncbi:hypothetical protein ACEN9X_19795 [Mucilaginibacter sp. Mucisp86]|uniref:hypothetical protein n=1 Tax=Mucilaginibacter sp. Mucisp86 TaxID=3243060 RepID=UPI0039B42EB0
MRYLLTLFILSLMLGCSQRTPKRQTNQNVSQHHKEDSILVGGADTIDISTIKTKMFKYSKADLRTILRHNPELNDSMPVHPDITYGKRGICGDSTIDKSDPVDIFSSEIGQDDYYLLYAYFLKKRNGGEKYQKERETLIKIYRDINFIFGRLAQGGTYFGHQDNRILGEAEYSIYRGKGNDYYDKSYDITKQKMLYLNALKQQITDELSSNFDFPDKEKPKLKKELFETVKELDGLITDYFYLESTRTFQYSSY